jgi:excisionase family DNA binding protein
MSGQTLISIADAATRLGVSTLTIRRRIASGELTAFRVGPRLIRVDADEVERLAKPLPTVMESGS